MLDSLALAHPVQGYNARFHAVSIADIGSKAVRVLDRARDQKASLTSPLDRCREGWAKAISHPVSKFTGRSALSPLKGRHIAHTRGIAMTFDDIAGLIYETTCTAHLACSAETDEVDPSGPVSIIGADGSMATKVLLPGD
jgi:hypothetical protein